MKLEVALGGEGDRGWPVQRRRREEGVEGRDPLGCRHAGRCQDGQAPGLRRLVGRARDDDVRSGRRQPDGGRYVADHPVDLARDERLLAGRVVVQGNELNAHSVRLEQPPAGGEGGGQGSHERGEAEAQLGKRIAPSETGEGGTQDQERKRKAASPRHEAPPYPATCFARLYRPSSRAPKGSSIPASGAQEAAGERRPLRPGRRPGEPPVALL